MGDLINKLGGKTAVMIITTVVVSIGLIAVLAASRKDDLTQNEETLVEIAKSLGLDETKFVEDMRSDEVKKIVSDQDADATARLGGRRSTPAVYLNSEKIEASVSFEQYKTFMQAEIDEEKAKETPNLPLTLEVFEDFQCPACSQFFPVVVQIDNAFSNEELVVEYKNLPLAELHSFAEKYAYAAEAARMQGKFLEYARELYEMEHGLDYSTQLDGIPPFATTEVVEEE
jgi:protein-disulfide isomerase